MNNEWRPIKTAPKDGRPLLLLSPEGFVGFGRMSTEVRAYADGDEWVREDACWIGRRRYESGVSFWMGGITPSEATHWAPVPKPPEAAQGIEARRAVDAEGGAVGDESPVGNADAPR